jgi:ACR3 family arsenite efflux pump ArsB
VQVLLETKDESIVLLKIGVKILTTIYKISSEKFVPKISVLGYIGIYCTLFLIFHFEK